jgi:hypothetical protein
MIKPMLPQIRDFQVVFASGLLLLSCVRHSSGGPFVAVAIG